MARAIILRTKEDDKVWLVNFEKGAVSEITSEVADDLAAPVTEVATLEAAQVRASAAAFPFHVVQ
jgi:hypothetical protein